MEQIHFRDALTADRFFLPTRLCCCSSVFNDVETDLTPCKKGGGEAAPAASFPKDLHCE